MTLLRGFWRKNFSRKWAESIQVHHAEGMTPIQDETISGRSTLCVLGTGLYVTIDGLIDPSQKILLIRAHQHCNAMSDSPNYADILKDYILTK